MLVISLIPYRKATFNTHLTVEEIRREFSRTVASRRLYAQYDRLSRLPQEPFVDEVESTTFRLRRIRTGLSFRRSGPIYSGKIVDLLNHRQVRITVHPGATEWVFYGIVFAITLYWSLITDIDNELPRTLFWIVAYILHVLDFNIRSYNTLRLLKVMIQSEQE